MKGITHFLTGVATASCFPIGMQSVFMNKSFFLPLGGLFGICCDTLDFRFARYFWKHDHVLRINEDDLDPKVIAEGYAKAIDEAFEQKKTIYLKVDIIRLSGSFYRTINIFLDDKRKEVTVMIGSIKTMSHVMERLDYLPDYETMKKSIEDVGAAKTLEKLIDHLPSVPDSRPVENHFYTAKFKADVVNTYYQDTEVGIFSGPDFAFTFDNDKIRIDFIPWHRQWSHSLTLGLVMGPIGFAIYAGWAELFAGNLAGFFNPLAISAFFMAILAVWSHIFVDQTGHLGSNLFYPITKERSQGLEWTTSASVFPNIFVNYLSIAIIIWNINAFAPTPAFTLPWAASVGGDFSNAGYYLISLLNYIVYFVAIPLGALYGITKLYSRLYYHKRASETNEYFDVSSMSGESGDM